MYQKRFHSILALLFCVVTAIDASGQASLAQIDAMRKQGKYKEALAALEQHAAKQPNSADVLWRLSRTRVDIGETAAKNAQSGYYTAALKDAASAVKHGPSNAEAHVAYAIAAGRVGLISSSKRKVELSREVKEHVDRALALNSRHGIAYHVRGRWNYEVASLGFIEKAAVRMVYGGLPDASFQKAAADFQKAIQFNENVINQLELGKTYLKLNDKAKAKAAFQRAMALPNSDPDDARHKAEAQSLLKKM